MKTTNTIQPLVSFTTRAAVLAGAVAIAAGAWATAGHESRRAVDSEIAAFGPNAPIYVTLPRVEIVAKRRLPAESALAAANNPHNEL